MTLVSFVLDEFTVSPPLMDVYMRLLSAPGDSVVQYDSGIRSVCVCVLYCVPTQEMQLKPPQLQLRTIKTKVIEKRGGDACNATQRKDAGHF
eukprot:m.207291 g.207291  ORF g.207291 m.207291 type:complete len:92 (-) comp18924_c0_seq5:338-613(-)